MKCVVCAQGKHARSPFNDNGTRAKKLLEIIHTDVCGPFPVKSLGGAKYYVSFIDDFSRKVCIFPLKSKTEVFSKFIEYKKLVENQLESKIKTLRSDNGTEYVNNQFEAFFKEHGITHQKSTPHSPQQNGLSERMNRTILDKTRCMLLDSKLPKHFWAAAVQAAVNVTNSLPNSPNGIAPDELWYNKKCNLKHFRVFGSKAMVWKPEMKRGKLDSKSFECVYLRRADDAKAFRLYDMNTRKIIISHDVIFMENETKVIDSNCVTKSSKVFIENDECSDEILEIGNTTNDSNESTPTAMGENIPNISPGAESESTESIGERSNNSILERSDILNDTFESTTGEMNVTTVDDGALDSRHRDPDFRTRAKTNEDADRVQTRSVTRSVLNYHCELFLFLANRKIMRRL